MKVLMLISRFIVGIVFIFSGTVKAIDPLGSTYKFQDYFQAFHLNFLDFLSLPLSFLLFTAEFIAGVSVLTGLKYKTGIWTVLLMMLIFTPLTFILALTNPVSDCGCFGDAVHLTNWETFGKNIVLLSLTIFLFKNRDMVKSRLRPASEWPAFSGIVILFILFSLYNLIYLPVIDFLPYKKGVRISESMIIPEGMPADEYHTTFIYEKDGVQKEFSLENYPADDTTWKFIDQKSILIKRGYQPPIHDFVLTTLSNEDITERVLSAPGYTLLMITKKLGEANNNNLNKGFELGHYLSNTPVAFYVLTSSGTEEIENYNNGHEYCLVDETTLKTMIRSNPGYILLKNGTITDKWSWAGLPGNEVFAQLPGKPDLN